MDESEKRKTNIVLRQSSEPPRRTTTVVKMSSLCEIGIRIQTRQPRCFKVLTAYERGTACVAAKPLLCPAAVKPPLNFPFL
jgi:hypothetical protein